MAVNTKVTLRVDSVETGSSNASQTKVSPHLWEITAEYISGTANSQGDKVYHKTISLAAATSSLDLRGSLSDEFGVALNMAEVILIAVKNSSTTAADTLTITSTVPWLSGTTPAVLVGPGGFNVWGSPIDGVATSAGTADTITFDPGAKSFSIEVLIVGRSS